jgi:hypothetical protein
MCTIAHAFMTVAEYREPNEVCDCAHLISFISHLVAKRQWLPGGMIRRAVKPCLENRPVNKESRWGHSACLPKMTISSVVL